MLLRGLCKLAICIFVCCAANAERPDVLWTSAGTQPFHLAMSRDGKFFATSGLFEESVRIWRVNDGSYVRTIQTSYSTIWSIAFTADSQYIITGREGVAGDDRATVEMWRVSDGALVRSFNPGENDNYTMVWTVDTSPDGNYVAVAFGHYLGIRLYNVNSGNLVRTLDGGGWNVRFPPDSRLVAGSINGQTRVWRVFDGAPVQTIDTASTKVAFSPDSAHLAITSD